MSDKETFVGHTLRSWIRRAGCAIGSKPSVHRQKKGRTMIDPKRLALSLAQVDLLGAAQDFLIQFGLDNSPTSRARRFDIPLFLDFVAQASGLAVGDLTAAHVTNSVVRMWLDERQSVESPATVNRRYWLVRGFFRELAQTVPGADRAIRSVRPPALPPPRFRGLTDEKKMRLAEIEAAAPAIGHYTASRNRAIVVLAAATGLRLNEITRLRMGQIDPDLKWIRNLTGKGRKVRHVYVDERCRIVLADYLAARRLHLARFVGNPESLPERTAAWLPLFMPRKVRRPDLARPESFRCCAKTIYRSIKKEALTNPHSFRHQRTHDILDTTRDLSLAQSQLGHSDPRTTLSYLAKPDTTRAALLELVRPAGPRGSDE